MRMPACLLAMKDTLALAIPSSSTETPMTTQATDQPRRIFKYGGKTFPDPGGDHTPQQVLDHLKTYFPELGSAKIDEKRLPDGTLEITFSKQVTHNGVS